MRKNTDISTAQSISVPNSALETLKRSLYKSLKGRCGKDPNQWLDARLAGTSVPANGTLEFDESFLGDFVAALNDGPVKKKVTPDELLLLMRNSLKQYLKELGDFRAKVDEFYKTIGDLSGPTRLATFRLLSEPGSKAEKRPTSDREAHPPGEREILENAVRNNQTILHVRRAIREAQHNPHGDRQDFVWSIWKQFCRALDERGEHIATRDGVVELRSFAFKTELLQHLEGVLTGIFPQQEIPPLNREASELLADLTDEDRGAWMKTLNNACSQDEFEKKIADLGDHHLESNLRRIYDQIQARYSREKRGSYITKALAALCSGPSIKTLDEQSVIDLVDIAIGIAMNPHYKVRITVGFGGTHDETNARVPAYTVAVAQMMDSIIELSSTMKEQSGLAMAIPELHLMSAHHAAQAFNGMDPDITQRHADENLKLAMAYLKEFHPKVAPHTRSVQDRPELYQHQSFQTLRDALPMDELPEEVRKRLETMSLHHNMSSSDPEITLGKAFSYATAHPIIFGDMVPADSEYRKYMFGEHETPDATITIGGNPERNFNIVRRLARRIIETRADLGQIIPKSVMIICKEGDTPVYYKNGDEPTLRQVAEGNTGKGPFTANFHYDWKSILEDIVRAQDGRLPKEKPALAARIDAAEKTLIDFLKKFWDSRTAHNDAVAQ